MKTFIVTLSPRHSIAFAINKEYVIPDFILSHIVPNKDKFRLLFACERIPEKIPEDYELFLTGNDDYNPELIKYKPELITYRNNNCYILKEDVEECNTCPISVANGKVFASTVICPLEFYETGDYMKVDSSDIIFFYDNLESLDSLPTKSGCLVDSFQL